MGSSSAANRRWHENTSQNMPFATRAPKAMSAHAIEIRGSSMPKGGNEVKTDTRPTCGAFVRPALHPYGIEIHFAAPARIPFAVSPLSPP
jgi:hypothetical protein